MDVAKPLTSNVVAELVNNHRRFLSFLRSRVGNLSDAEDILQAAFVKAVKKSDSIWESESVVAWFFRLLRNAVIDHYRHQDAEGRALDRLAEMNVETDAMVRDFERAVCRCVTDLLPTLKDDYSALLGRVDMEGASIAEVSDETNMTANNTRVKLHRARTALRKMVQLSCGTCAEHGCLDCDCQRPD